MRVMTFNLRFENDRDGPNSWRNRREMVVEIIERYAPDILGTQEGKWPQLAYLQEHLTDYLAHMPGRIPDEMSQCPTLFVRKARFDIRGGADIWLSKTPEIYLSKDWDSAFPRMMSHADLFDRQAGQNLCAAVTHLDHVGIEARFNQAKIIADWALAADSPVVLLGDFNDSPGSRVHDVLVGPETNLCDTWQVLEKTDGPASFTHHGFAGNPQVTRMDWILVSSCFTVVDAEIVRDQENGSYPSDHFPYMADIKGVTD